MANDPLLGIETWLIFAVFPWIFWLLY